MAGQNDPAGKPRGTNLFFEDISGRSLSQDRQPDASFPEEFQRLDQCPERLFGRKRAHCEETDPVPRSQDIRALGKATCVNPVPDRPYPVDGDTQNVDHIRPDGIGDGRVAVREKRRPSPGEGPECHGPPGDGSLPVDHQAVSGKPSRHPRNDVGMEEEGVEYVDFCIEHFRPECQDGGGKGTYGG